MNRPRASIPRHRARSCGFSSEILRRARLPAIINIHDVPLAQQFMQRIVACAPGRVVFDGPPEQLNEAALTENLRRKRTGNAMRRW